MRRLVLPEKTPLIAAACAGLAAWISLGSLANAETNAGLDRIGLLPPLWLLPVLIVGFVGIAWVIRLAGATSLPLFFSLILLLPWLPGSIPAAFLLWTGRMVVVVWLVVFIAMIAVRLRQGFGESAVALRAEAERMGPASFVAAVAAFALYLAAGSSLAAARTIPGGDEPHYLVLTQSLLRDRDLQIENNHARGDYREYFGGVLRPDYLKRGIDGAIYSIHAPGLPAIVAPAYALFGYPGVVIFLSMVGAIGSALLWRASYVLTESHSAAWFGWAAGALTVPYFFEAFAVYPDGVGATLILFAAVPLLSSESSVGRVRWIFTGAALAVLPWLHTRFALISAVLGFVLLLRLVRLKPDTTSDIRLKPDATSRWRVVAFLLVPAVSAIAWFGFFKAVYGTFNPSVPYGGNTQSSPINIVNGLTGLLLDQQFGILPNAPVYGFCFAGMIALARHRLRPALELSAISGLYILSVSAFHMWWGGSSSPARLVVPVLPLLALPGAWLWKSSSFSTRAIGLAALLVSLAITAVMALVDGGRLAYNFRDGYARAAEWLSPLVYIPQGLPSLFRQTPFGAWVRASFWFAAVFGVVLLVRGLEARGASRAKLAFATPVALAIAVMLSLTAIWKMDGVEARRTGISQLHLLQDYDTRVRPIGITPAAVRFESPDRILAKVNIATTERHTQSLLLVPGIVAGGRYELRLAPPATATGTAALVIGRMASAIKTWDLTKDFVGGSAELDLPVNVGSLVIERHATAADSELALTLHPKQIWEGSSRLTGEFARRAQRYGPAVVYFFDDGAFAEKPGFWIRGGGFSQIAAAQMDDDAPLRLFVRNAPVVNRVTLETDGEENVLNLQPGEERVLPIQVAKGRPAALIRFRSDNGFRPSESESGSTDTRFLGVWIEFR